MFVLDTNSLIYFFKGLGAVGERMLATPPGELALPSVVLYELETGLAKSSAPVRRRRQLTELLEVLPVLPFGVEEARASAHLRAAVERAGRPLGPIDVLIAGTAVAHRATLVTRNVEEFGRVPGLTVENWY